MDIVSKAWCRESRIEELEAENQEFAAEIRHLSERMSELLTQNALMREALGDAITFKEGTEPYEDAVRLCRELEQSDEN